MAEIPVSARSTSAKKQLRIQNDPKPKGLHVTHSSVKGTRVITNLSKKTEFYFVNRGKKKQNQLEKKTPHSLIFTSYLRNHYLDNFREVYVFKRRDRNKKKKPIKQRQEPQKNASDKKIYLTLQNCVRMKDMITADIIIQIEEEGIEDNSEHQKAQNNAFDKQVTITLQNCTHMQDKIVAKVVIQIKEEKTRDSSEHLETNTPVEQKEEADILKQYTSADDKIVAGIGIQIEESMHPEANHQETQNLEGEIKKTCKRTDGKIVAEIVFQIDQDNIIRQQLISQRANTTASDIWNDIKELGEPRIVISIVGAYNELISSYEWKHQVLLQDALTHVTRYAGKCGFLYKTMDIHLADTIIQKSAQCLPMLTYGYTSTPSTEDYDQNNGKTKDKSSESGLIQTEDNSFKSGLKKTEDNDSESGLKKLSEIESYINSEGETPFANVTGLNRKETKIQTEENTIRVPVVLLVVNGGFDTLEHVVRAIYNNISVVVVNGTGGTADLIVLSLKDMTKMKRQLPVLFARRFSNSMCEKIKQILNRIVQREWMITIFDVKKHSKEKLWEKLSDGIMRAWSFEEDKGS